jgi:hypothetical protein
MIWGAAVSTMYYSLKMKHPSLDMPMIDYDLPLLANPTYADAWNQHYCYLQCYIHQLAGDNI